VTDVEPDFVHHWPESTVVFGAGALALVAEQVTQRGHRALMISDPAALAAARTVADGLAERADVELVDRIDQVVMHVPAEVIAAGAARARRADADVLVCLGGGSSTGLAKGIARDLGLPIVAVPTTYAGSEMTSIWGSTENGRKTTARAEVVRPRAVVYDPELTLGLPPDLTVTSGINAIAHSVEALYAPRPSPLTQLTACEGIRALTRALPPLRKDPGDVSWRAAALRGAWLCGFALEVSTMSVHHTLCHVLGGLLDLPHSPLHTVVLPHAVAYTAPYAPEAMALLADALGIDDPSDTAGRLWDFADDLEAPTSLGAIGMIEADVDRAVDAAIAAFEATPPSNPRPLDRAAVEEFVRAAWRGQRPERAVSGATR
jgi:maleylacetate reductase